ncbi:MAG: ECF transporter S component [Armatimonadota bacterium]|nr:ECF transporter S component [Armatimonadota bacterium]MDR7450303.1 ECF transporter S component [Armatimonadota bacterium]MDR7467114.1 ECF transporter S component [Armatimonadota bacterium]MDR7493344.1 ECF transporter S component [Armatimonadota bacterium]MDR7499352.1 ECF transporter S component [Armatimonadota bacterium]
MKAREVAAAAIFIALTFVVTRYTVIPIPATKGYFNLGEVVIYLAAIVFGPLVGALAGGVGAALADLAAAPPFAPFTLVVKGIEGLLVGWLAGRTSASRVGATLVGGAWMVAGYFAVEVIFARRLGIAPTPTLAVGAALTEVPFNVVQVLSGVIVSVLVASRLRSLAPGRLAS